MEKLKLLNEVDYEYYETSMIRQFSKPKEVKYEGKARIKWGKKPYGLCL